MNTLKQNHIDQLDDPEALLSRWEPSFCVAIVTYYIHPGEQPDTYSETLYQGRDGTKYSVLRSKMFYSAQEAWVVVEKTRYEIEHSTRYAVARRLNPMLRKRVELRFADEKLAQKNDAKYERNRQSYQRRKERERLTLALRLDRKNERLRRKREVDAERECRYAQ